MDAKWTIMFYKNKFYNCCRIFLPTKASKLPMLPTPTQESWLQTNQHYMISNQESSSTTMSSRTLVSNTMMPSSKTQEFKITSSNTQLMKSMPKLPLKMPTLKITETCSRTQDLSIIFSNTLKISDPWLLEYHMEFQNWLVHSHWWWWSETLI